MGFQTLNRVLPWQLPPSPKVVLILLAHHLDDRTGRCDPSISRLAAESGLKERAVYLSVRRLVEAGALVVEPQPGRRSSYRISPSYPCTTCTPALHAPLHDVQGSRPSPLHQMQDTPALHAQTPAPGAGDQKDQKDIRAELGSARQQEPSAGDGTALDLFTDDSTSQPPAPANPQARIPTDTPLPDLGPDAADLVGPVFPIKGGSWRMKRANLETFARTFPNIDLDVELQKAATWCESNPRKQKTAQGMLRFINLWLGRAKPAAPADGYSDLDRIALSMPV
jgi:hypothetical protein